MISFFKTNKPHMLRFNACACDRLCVLHIGGRFIGAGVNFGIGAMVLHMKTLGTPIALTAIAFVIGLVLIPFAPETRGEELPQ